MLNLNESFKALSLSLSAEPEILNSSKYNFNANQKGRSMIEMLGVLAIIGVLSVGGIAGYSKAMLKYKTNKTIDQVTMLTTNIRTLFAQQKKFTGIDTSTNAESLFKLGVVPDEMYNATTKALSNPFSGSVMVTIGNSLATTATDLSGKDRAFIIEVNNLPKEACMAIATSDWGSNYSSGLIGMAVKASSAGTALAEVYAGATTTAANMGKLSESGAIAASGMPIKVANASAACASDSSNSIAFKYY